MNKIEKLVINGAEYTLTDGSAVAFDKIQTLSGEQKLQACENIGAAMASDVENEIDRLDGLIAGLEGGGTGVSVTVDAALNPDSTNPVQNKVICEQLNLANAALAQIVAMIPNETAINALIDAKLGVIENGTY